MNRVEHGKKYGAPNLKSWKKGQSGNPGGGRKLPPELLPIKEINRYEVKRVISKIFAMEPMQLIEHLKDPHISAHELLVGKIFAEAVKSGDHSRLEFLYNRLIGKVSDKVIHEAGEGSAFAQIVISLPDNKKSAIKHE
jgi:hypothetical protein